MLALIRRKLRNATETGCLTLRCGLAGAKRFPIIPAILLCISIPVIFLSCARDGSRIASTAVSPDDDLQYLERLATEGAQTERILAASLLSELRKLHADGLPNRGTAKTPDGDAGRVTDLAFNDA